MLNLLLNCLIILGLVVTVELIGVALLLGAVVIVAICEKIVEVAKVEKRK